MTAARFFHWAVSVERFHDARKVSFHDTRKVMASNQLSIEGAVPVKGRGGSSGFAGTINGTLVHWPGCCLAVGRCRRPALKGGRVFSCAKTFLIASNDLFSDHKLCGQQVVGIAVFSLVEFVDPTIEMFRLS
jgi:hypothetical protein